MADFTGNSLVLRLPFAPDDLLPSMIVQFHHDT